MQGVDDKLAVVGEEAAQGGVPLVSVAYIGNDVNDACPSVYPAAVTRAPVAHDDVVVLGGCGRAGLPLALTLADHGYRVAAYDIRDDSVATVASGTMPFREDGADSVLARVLAAETFSATTDPSVVAQADVVVVIIGTPVDDHLNPDPEAVSRALADVEPYLASAQLLVLRSTVFPGVTASVERHMESLGLEVDVAFCPERIAEGKAMTELLELPQIVGARTERAGDRASAFFSRLGSAVIRTTPEEAELAKLFTNAWRYVKFATANQFFVMANDFGVDYGRVRDAITLDYPRAADLPGAGFAAGPCLLKDTMQLAAFTNNAFVLGHAAMLVNEGLPLYLVSRLERSFDLSATTVGILGMAFKAESDDVRESLAYKLRKILRFRARDVVCSDPYVTSDSSLVPLGETLATSDVIVIGAPHAVYRDVRTEAPVVDIWGITETGTCV